MLHLQVHIHYTSIILSIIKAVIISLIIRLPSTIHLPRLRYIYPTVAWHWLWHNEPLLGQTSTYTQGGRSPTLVTVARSHLVSAGNTNNIYIQCIYIIYQIYYTSVWSKIWIRLKWGRRGGVWTPYPRGSTPLPLPKFFLPTPPPFFPYFFFRVPPPKIQIFFAPIPRPSDPRPPPIFR